MFFCRAEHIEHDRYNVITLGKARMNGKIYIFLSFTEITLISFHIILLTGLCVDKMSTCESLIYIDANKAKQSEMVYCL